MPVPEHLTIGRYQLLGELGRGGMGVVYLARQSGLDRTVALKELGVLGELDPRLAQRFVREARLAGSLAHPNIVTVHEYFENDGRAYIAMEYLAAGSLRPSIGDLSLAQIAIVLEGVLSGLAHAERSTIVHRDLKPENLMMMVDGTVKIADFGIAKALNEAGVDLTAAGTTLGTPAYMAPEQVGAGAIGPWTDLYAVGAITYEMLSGRVPFAGAGGAITIMSVRTREAPPPLATVRPGIDSELSDWVSSLLDPDPARRPQHAEDAWNDLEDIIIRLLGPRWRREGRVRDDAVVPAVSPPAADVGGGDSDPEFATYLGTAVPPPASAPDEPAAVAPGPSAPEPTEPEVLPAVPDPPPAVDPGEFRTYQRVEPPPPVVSPAQPPESPPPQPEPAPTIVYPAVRVPAEPQTPAAAPAEEPSVSPPAGPDGTTAPPPGASWVWPSTPEKRQQRRSRRRFAIGGVIALLVAGGVGYALSIRSDSSPAPPASTASSQQKPAAVAFNAAYKAKLDDLLAQSARSRTQVAAALAAGTTQNLQAVVGQRRAQLRLCRALPVPTGTGSDVAGKLCTALAAALLADRRYAAGDQAGGDSVSSGQAQPAKVQFVAAYRAACKKLGLEPSRFARAGLF